ncbi:type VI secretion system-associated protein TagF [Noviherbaspirillum sp.]|uniref:type VI secretion system-associated protein TagF n=1 Tax=Noviherbaspirillum sp. TaxID=1926288 RepID=UPI002B488193|nr:type VI secretion system-associated protein TagF [Noviherbaspirillum sp.]HJV82750.1 type VI secretion system-associated protein TagF [Noviherbaspirillum sp.]
MSSSNAIQLRNSSSLYFGKIASRGDFVKSASGTKVIALIDNWIAQGMELLIANPGWKNYYDNAGPVDFLLLGTRKKRAICGSLIPSGDASSRRFPFVAATLFETDDALEFLHLSPMVLERHVNHQRALIHHAAKAHDAVDTLITLGDVPLEAEFARGKVCDGYDQFLGSTSVAGLANALGISDGQSSVRQMVLAIGYLLQPILTNYTVAPQKGLAMPLPRDPARLALVKALWLQLISVFLSRSDFELSVFSCMHFGSPKLILTFNGTTPTIFRALFEEDTASATLIDISRSTWVEDHALQDVATLKLSSYLEHEELSLQQLVETFRQGFSG